MKTWPLILTVCLISVTIHAKPTSVENPPSEAQAKAMALVQTQQVLTDPTKRQGALDTDKAKAVDRDIGVATMGNKNMKNEIYNISSDLLPWVSEMGQGEAEAMQKLLQDAQSNPEAVEKFLQRMPAVQRQKIEAISKQIEAQRNAATDKIQVNP